ncbi:MAG: hypothetical protein HYY35_08265 [Deltaproteobacteria bacterium]|nr:hypothetical protein [Deltaproteobacteria bacterium]
MSVEDDRAASGLAGARRVLAWVCMVVFAASFVGLLVLSATVYWTPENSWIALLDRAWRISGAVGVLLWALPRAAHATRWLSQLFSGRA